MICVWKQEACGEVVCVSCKRSAPEGVDLTKTTFECTAPPRRHVKIPGMAAIVAVITPNCRLSRGDQGAIDEALRRVREVMVETLGNWPPEKAATFFLSFNVDRAGRQSIAEA